MHFCMAAQVLIGSLDDKLQRERKTLVNHFLHSYLQNGRVIHFNWLKHKFEEYVHNKVLSREVGVDRFVSQVFDEQSPDLYVDFVHKRMSMSSLAACQYACARTLAENIPTLVFVKRNAIERKDIAVVVREFYGRLLRVHPNVLVEYSKMGELPGLFDAYYEHVFSQLKRFQIK